LDPICSGLRTPEVLDLGGQLLAAQAPFLPDGF